MIAAQAAYLTAKQANDVDGMVQAEAMFTLAQNMVNATNTNNAQRGMMAIPGVPGPMPTAPMPGMAVPGAGPRNTEAQPTGPITIKQDANGKLIPG